MNYNFDLLLKLRMWHRCAIAEKLKVKGILVVGGNSKFKKYVYFSFTYLSRLLQRRFFHVATN